jgi:hypothetical protein
MIHPITLLSKDSLIDGNNPRVASQVLPNKTGNAMY